MHTGVTTKTKETIKFVNPTRNKIVGSRYMKTCRRRAGGNFHLRAAFDGVGILTVFSGEDATQWTALRPAQERLLAGDSEQLPPRTLTWRSARPRNCASTPSRSRFNAAVGDATDSRVRLRSRHAGAGARMTQAAMATEGVEDWAESEQKGLFRYATGSWWPMFVAVSVCPRPRQCPRLRPCLFFGAEVSKVLKR